MSQMNKYTHSHTPLRQIDHVSSQTPAFIKGLRNDGPLSASVVPLVATEKWEELSPRHGKHSTKGGSKSTACFNQVVLHRSERSKAMFKRGGGGERTFHRLLKRLPEEQRQKPQQRPSLLVGFFKNILALMQLRKHCREADKGSNLV